MLRAKLYKTVNLYGSVWAAQVGKTVTYWAEFEQAKADLNKRMTRAFKEESAYSMARLVRAADINVVEAALIRKLCKSRCKGITPKQWGFLKGIYERQERVW